MSILQNNTVPYFSLAVGYDIEYNTYHWQRKPHIQEDINLDNHEVDIVEYNFTYASGDGTKFLFYLFFKFYYLQS